VSNLPTDQKTWTVSQTGEAVRSGQISAEAVVTHALQAVDVLNDKVNAFTDVTADRAVSEARAVDRALAGGGDLPLAGVPYAVKNLYDIEGLPTRAGSRINRENPPAGKDAFLVSRLKAAGAVLVGATNMDEYAYGFTGENAHDGNSRNPHDTMRMTGGSSGGSGAAAASGMVPLALGSDTNGSIRVPAAFCGLFGLKPTYGRLSRSGAYLFTGSLDHVGPLCRSAKDLSLVFDVLQGPDPTDPAQADKPYLQTLPELSETPDDLRIGVTGGYFTEKADSEALGALETVTKALGVSETVIIPEAARARAAAYVITTAESSALHLRRIQTRPGDFDPDTRDRFISGAMVPAVWVQQAQRFRSWYREQVLRLFDDVDLLIAPATPFPALPSGTKTITLAGEELPARPNIGLFTQPISFIGLPVVTVPVWLEDGKLPLGVQLIAPPWREDLALKVAHQLEMNGVVSARIATL
jgi:AtzE family amidohydrolase